MQQYIAVGEIGPNDLVWKSGMQNWQPGGAVPGLFIGVGPPYPDSHNFSTSVLTPPDSTPSEAPRYVQYFPGTLEPEYAGLLIRIAATIVDAVVLCILWTILVFPFAIYFQSNYKYLSQQNDQLDAITNVVMLLGFWLYFAIMESSSKQATLGKMALRLRVTDLQYQRISFLRASIRLAMKIVSYVALFMGFIWIAFAPRKRGWHDLIAGTLVSKKPL